MTELNSGSTYIHAVVADHSLLRYYQSVVMEWGYGYCFISPDELDSDETLESLVEFAVNDMFEYEKREKVVSMVARLLVDFTGQHDQVLSKVKQMNIGRRVVVLDGTKPKALEQIHSFFAQTKSGIDTAVSIADVYMTRCLSERRQQIRQRHT